MNKFKNAIENIINANVETSGDGYEKMVQVLIGATLKQQEKYSPTSPKEGDILSYATYKGILIGLENALGLYKDHLEIQEKENSINSTPKKNKKV